MRTAIYGMKILYIPKQVGVCRAVCQAFGYRDLLVYNELGMRRGYSDLNNLAII